MALSLAMGVSVVAVSPSAVAAPKVSKPKNSKARKHYDAALKAYMADDFDKAVEEANKGLKIEEHAPLLFILAQSERQRDNCVVAVELLTRFLEMTENETMRENALTAKGFCAEKLAEEARQKELEEQLASDIEQEPEPEPEPAPAPKPARPWYRDPLGGVLVGVGGVSLLAGGALLITGARITQVQAPDYGTHDRRLKLQPQLLIAGAITGGVGVLLAAGGGLRWGLVARKAKKSKAAASKPSAGQRLDVGPWVSGSRTGLVVSGRF